MEVVGLELGTGAGHSSLVHFACKCLAGGWTGGWSGCKLSFILFCCMDGLELAVGTSSLVACCRHGLLSHAAVDMCL
ncbi:hypothetical protein U1Q18_013368 [Sarracenia purpurea var. burkii]